MSDDRIPASPVNARPVRSPSQNHCHNLTSIAPVMSAEPFDRPLLPYGYNWYKTSCARPA